MGYTTEFDGKFKITPTLKEKHKKYLEKFAAVRHMKLKPNNLKDKIRESVNLPSGLEGMYNTLELEYKYTIDHNEPPDGVPGLWLGWIPSDCGTLYIWDQSEKFYDYIEWLQFCIDHFFEPWGYILNGDVKWRGEDPDDIGMISVINNIITIKKGKIIYE